MSKQYEVEDIVDSRMVNSKIEYLIKWKDYSEDDNTWEPAANLKNSQDLLQKYKDRMREKEEAAKLAATTPTRGKKVKNAVSPKVPKTPETSSDDDEDSDVDEMMPKRRTRKRSSTSKPRSVRKSARLNYTPVVREDVDSSEEDLKTRTPTRSQKRHVPITDDDTVNLGSYLRKTGAEIVFVNFKFDDKNLKTMQTPILEDIPSQSDIKKGISYIYAELKPKKYVVKLTGLDVLAVVDKKAVQNAEMMEFQNFKTKFHECIESLNQDIAKCESAIQLHYKNLREKAVPEDKGLRADIHFRREQIEGIDRNAKMRYDAQKKILSGHALSKGLDVLDEHQKAYESEDDPKIFTYTRVRTDITHHRAFFEEF
uniref:Chromo domain-containing protein n=1 Tax=Panagrolaimus sp. JU765 TaxID=591449 RepID=A0AC34QKA4_9BILA